MPAAKRIPAVRTIASRKAAPPKAVPQKAVPQKAVLRKAAPRKTVAATPRLEASATAPGLKLTNPDKVFYPQTGFTKGEVLRYYREIAPYMLPHLAGRPVSLRRMPDGVQGLSFFEKRAPANRPEWVHTTDVHSSSHGTLTYLVVDNLPTLLWLANRAALEFHTYLFRGGREDAPLSLIFDLDPGAPATLRECLPLALEIRDLLAELGLRSYAKSSGGKGIHIIVPLDGKTPFDGVKQFAHATAAALEAHHPDLVTTSMSKAVRPGRIFIDWSQNDHGKTTVAPYSLRARDRPTASAPLTWEEIERAHARGTPERLVFDADGLLARVLKTGDLLAPCLTLAQRLPATRRGRRTAR